MGLAGDAAGQGSVGGRARGRPIGRRRPVAVGLAQESLRLAQRNDALSTGADAHHRAGSLQSRRGGDRRAHRHAIRRAGPLRAAARLRSARGRTDGQNHRRQSADLAICRRGLRDRLSRPCRRRAGRRKFSHHARGRARLGAQAPPARARATWSCFAAVTPIAIIGRFRRESVSSAACWIVARPVGRLPPPKR